MQVSDFDLGQLDSMLGLVNSLRSSQDPTVGIRTPCMLSSMRPFLYSTCIFLSPMILYPGLCLVLWLTKCGDHTVEHFIHVTPTQNHLVASQEQCMYVGPKPFSNTVIVRIVTLGWLH